MQEAVMGTILAAGFLVMLGNLPAKAKRILKQHIWLLDGALCALLLTAGWRVPSTSALYTLAIASIVISISFRLYRRYG